MFSNAYPEHKCSWFCRKVIFDVINTEMHEANAVLQDEVKQSILLVIFYKGRRAKSK
jgi:hypothetical protein